MKLPDLYTDWKVMLGTALIVLGAGNWVIGIQRTELYGRTVAASGQSPSPAEYRKFDDLDAEAGGAVLAPLTTGQEQVSYATARMDFYHAAYLAGRVMVVAGVLVALIGFIGVIQSDTRRVLRGSSPPGPARVRTG